LNYEGLRQSLNQTSVAFVPSLASRAAAVPTVVPLLNLRPTPTASAPDFSGISPFASSPLQAIREDFGTARVDHRFSQRDSLAAIYTADDGGDVTATIADPFSTDILNLREQVLGLEETHVFSPTLLNTARVGYSRAGYFFTGEPTPGTQRQVPAAAPYRTGVESVRRKDRRSRRVWHVQRLAGRARLSHGPERAVQSDIQHRQ
jgi:hypothetical protein